MQPIPEIEVFGLNPSGVKVGKLFIANLGSGPTVGMVVQSASNPDNQKELLILGPSFLGGENSAFKITSIVKRNQNEWWTALSIAGASFRLPVDPSAWDFGTTSEDDRSLVVVNKCIYLRAKIGAYDRIVDVTSGLYMDNLPTGHSAFPKTWEIIAPVKGEDSKVIFEFKPKKIA